MWSESKARHGRRPGRASLPIARTNIGPFEGRPGANAACEAGLQLLGPRGSAPDVVGDDAPGAVGPAEHVVAVVRDWRAQVSGDRRRFELGVGERGERVPVDVAEEREADGGPPGDHLVELAADRPDREAPGVAFGFVARLAGEVREQRRSIQGRREERGLVEVLEVAADRLGGFGEVRRSQRAVLGLPGRPDQPHRQLRRGRRGACRARRAGRMGRRFDGVGGGAGQARGRDREQETDHRDPGQWNGGGSLSNSS
jgi:hypothetical protein